MAEKENGEQQRHIIGGYIRVARQLKESAIWSQDPHFLRLWTYLLLSARWDEKPIERGSVTIGRGQVLKSFRRIADDNEWTENRALKRWSTSRVKRMIDWLSENEMVSLRGTELGTLITIRNFNDYQDPESYRLEPGTELGTQSERSRNNRKKEKKGKKEKTTYPLDFERVWSIHHRGSKSSALKEWRKAVPDFIGQEDIERHLTAYVRSFTGDFKGAHLFRWIRDRRWEELQVGANGRARGTHMTAAEVKEWAEK